MGAYGGALPDVLAGPAGGSGSALKIVKPTGQEAWGGIYFSTAAIPFTADRKTITARVYSTKAGSVIKLKVESKNGGPAIEIASAATGAANTWQTVTWVMAGIDVSKSYTTIAITPDQETVASGQVYYLDDITLAAAASATPTPTPTPAPVPTDYLYLTDNAISLYNGTTTAAYSMGTFQSTGINIKWPMADTAAIKLNLSENGNFSMGAGQTLNAAMEITETTPSGQGKIMGYINNVTVTKTGKNVTLTVPSMADANLYGVSSDGNLKAVISFANAVRGVTNTLSATANAVSTVILGEVVNFGINGVSNDFTGMNALRGKYQVKIVVSDLPLRKVDGTKFDTMTISVPTSISGGIPGSIIPVTGWGLTGYINLVD